MKIPFMNLSRQNQRLKQEYLSAFERIIASSGFILGREVAEFEQAFASYQGVNHCLGTSNGTTALHLALHACGIGPGDEVITVPNTFAATAEAIIHCGAKPVFVDVDPDSYLMEPSLLERAVTSKTRAVVPVHLHGAMAPLEDIQRIAESNDLLVIEDAAQAHGAELNGKRAGSFGQAAAFSFYPGKNLGALGDAGCVVTNDKGLHEKMAMLRNHGTSKKYSHELVGFNYRMDAFTGAVLGAKLPHLEKWTETRRKRAALYRELLEGSGLKLPAEQPGSRHVFYVFVVESPARDELIDFLAGQGIQAIIHYPVPLHLQKAFSALGYSRGDFPVAEQSADRMVSLPLCAEITEEEVAETCRAVKEFIST
ncbi:MAG: DegT/DnrJ/EryC1/StrS family aminotransferase [Candidatus Glassbacteria bacterium]|nr:DegT/DnrJ/EryC1/StrS family aminotransferase [Candidatus Glassbacteria bacterium]